MSRMLLITHIITIHWSHILFLIIFLCSTELNGFGASISSHILNDGDNTSDRLPIRCEFPTGCMQPNANGNTFSV